ncbi:MAG: tetratricopeptide repeat protein, partial [Deltaproteobacteria bacterium]|nr:tetratricopeptide repeat protein [Deltaproteobacteria bacterium]
DVALDMARAGEQLSRRLAGQPRRATMAGLVAAVSLETGMYEDAVHWYERARALYAEQGDWLRVVPMLRGKILALRLLDKNDDALLALSETLVLARKSFGVTEPLRSLVAQLLSGELMIEIPAVPSNVTRAIHGFTAEQEQEIAQAMAARILRQRGDLTRARSFDEQRLELVRRAAGDKRLGPRTELELMFALHESALVTARSGLFAEALARWSEALPLARKQERWGEAAVMIEAVSHVSMRSPGPAADEALAEARHTASDALEAPAIQQDAVLKRRFSRWLALHHFSLALAAAAPLSGGKSDFNHTLAALDAAAKEADAALRHAEQAADPGSGQPDLHGHLARVLGVAGADTSNKSDGIKSAPLSWRWRFDRALWDHDGAGVDPEWLLAAIEAFEAEPAPAPGRERSAFLAAAVDLLIARGQTDRAWQLLERDRLLDLQPARARLGPSLRSRWDALVQARGDAARYAALLEEASALVRAVEARPAPLAEVQGALEGATFIQGFALAANRVHWFVIDGKGLRHLSGARPADGELPAALLPDGGVPDSLYIDAGALYDRPAWQLRVGQAPLSGRTGVSEALSATYLVASREARALTDEEVLALGDSSEDTRVVTVAPDLASRAALAQLGANRLLVHIALPAYADANPFARAGLAQVTFAGASEIPPAERLDLDTLSSTRLASSLAAVDGLAASSQSARAVAQSFLFAGVATCMVGTPAPQWRDRMMQDLAHMRANAAFARLNAAHPEHRVWLIGYRGMDADERVAFAVQNLLALAKAGKPLFEKARAQKRPELWEQAKEVFSELVGTLDFLLHPRNLARLGASSDRVAQALVKSGTLPLRRTENQANLAQIHLALGELDEASALQELVVQSHEQSGDGAKLAEALKSLGGLLFTARRYPEATRRYAQCTRVAGDIKAAPIAAECSLQLGLSQRELFKYSESAAAIRTAIDLFSQEKMGKQVEAHRYLGFLYGDVLNRYDDALAEFEAAIVAAQTLGRKAMVTPLTVDVARIHRQRGDYEKALTEVRRAEAALKQASASDRAEVALEFAKIHWYRGNYRRALERQAQALELARAAGDTFREIQAVSLAGLIALNQRELARAERHIGAALDLARITKRRREEASQLNNLGIVLREAGRIDEALDMFHEALRIDEELGSSEGRAYDRR